MSDKRAIVINGIPPIIKSKPSYSNIFSNKDSESWFNVFNKNTAQNVLWSAVVRSALSIKRIEMKVQVML